MDCFLGYPDIKQKENMKVRKFLRIRFIGIGLKIGTDLHKRII